MLALHTIAKRTLALGATVALIACSSANEPLEQSMPPGERPDSTTGGSSSLNGRRPFPADNAWNLDVSGAQVDPRSSTLIASCGLRNLHPDFGTVWNGAPNGIPYVVVRAS